MSAARTIHAAAVNVNSDVRPIRVASQYMEIQLVHPCPQGVDAKKALKPFLLNLDVAFYEIHKAMAQCNIMKKTLFEFAMFKAWVSHSSLYSAISFHSISSKSYGSSHASLVYNSECSRPVPRAKLLSDCTISHSTTFITL